MKSSHVTIVGAGYVGLVTGACLADLGHEVICLDQDATKIEKLKSGQVTIHEPGLPELVQRNLDVRLHFTSDAAAAMAGADVIMIAVGTPSSEDGRADLSAVWAVVHQIAEQREWPRVIAVKSTVPVGTGDRVEEFLFSVARDSERHCTAPVAVVSNPEFLREGRAVHDFLQGDRVVVGGSDNEAMTMVADLYAPTGIPVIRCDRRSAEMIKYASNAFLATKISFINSIARLCEKLGADVTKVAEGMGRDHRIMPEHLRAGLGYGGSCFPKDVAALLHVAREAGVGFDLLQAAADVNARQVTWVVEKLQAALGSLHGKVIGLWGVAFKADTDDIRDAPALRLTELLVSQGALVKAYDPVARPPLIQGLTFWGDPYECATGADAMVLVTEWPIFRTLDWRKVVRLMNHPVIIDGRNYLDPQLMLSHGFVYRDLGRSAGSISVQDEQFGEQQCVQGCPNH